jgi:hypothetical protein
MLSRIQEGISVAVRRGRNAREAMREGVSSYLLGCENMGGQCKTTFSERDRAPAQGLL